MLLRTPGCGVSPFPQPLPGLVVSGGVGGDPYIQQQPHHIRLAAEGRLVQRRACLGLPVDVNASLQQEPVGGRGGGQRGHGWGGPALPSLPTAPTG